MSMMAILSIILGIISIAVFIWSINAMDSTSTKGKKKNNDSSIIGILVGLFLFFVSLGIYDGSGITIFSSSDNAQEQSSSSERRNSSSSSKSSKSDAQREVEESQARQSQSGESSTPSDSSISEDFEQSKPVKIDEKTRKQMQDAFQKWNSQLESQLQSIDTTWSALWADNSSEAVEKLIKTLENAKTQLNALQVPAELVPMHRQRLHDAVKRYNDWLDVRLKVCQMHLTGAKNQDILNELARGDSLKLRSNVEISTVGRELGINN